MTERPGWQRHLPNTLTSLRLAAAFVVVGLLAGEPSAGTLAAAAAVFLAAAGTDAADGFLARRWSLVSPFGRVMDPLADKVLVLGTAVALAGPALADADLGQRSGVQPWMAVALIARELLVTSLRAVYEARGVDFSASVTGKLKMIAQSVGLPAIIVMLALAAPPPDAGPAIDPAHAARINAWIAWTVVVVTVGSAAPYLARAASAPRATATAGEST